MKKSNEKKARIITTKENAIRKAFDIVNEDMVEAVAYTLVATEQAEQSKQAKSASLRHTANLLDEEYQEAWLAVQWNKLGKDLAAGYAKVAGDVALLVGQVKELHQINLALTSEEVGGSRQTWQNAKEWSRYCDTAKAKHPEVKKAREEAKAEAEANETPAESIAKVIKVLTSQYQYLAKIEEANDSVDSLMFDIGKILESNGVEMLDV